MAPLGLAKDGLPVGVQIVAPHYGDLTSICLLYTSDAADERSSVDLGGRRIIKKKKKEHECGRRISLTLMATTATL